MDEIPCSIDPPKNTTYAIQGSKEIVMKKLVFIENFLQQLSPLPAMVNFLPA